MPIQLTERELDIVSRTVYGEDDNPNGWTQIAAVIKRRFELKTNWWGKDIIGVCLHPYQFSCWTNNFASGKDFQRIMRASLDSDQSFFRANAIVLEVFSERTQPTYPTATHYHAASIRIPPDFISMTRLGLVGNNIFYEGK